MFAGGDGTARDIHDVVGNRIPLIGIPTGVMMHSAVFATSPESAGNVAAAYLGGRHSSMRVRDAEIMDIDEDQLRDDRVSTKLYGFARVPHERALVQSAKARAMTDDENLVAACAGLVEEMEDDRLYFIGPGTTTRRITERLGLDGSLLGVDAVMNRRLIGRDLNERQLLELLVGNATIIVTVIGGQGFIFGRGNQQVSADVLRRVGRDNIVVVAGLDKLLTLDPCCLRVDTNDAEVDAALRGFIPVHTGPGQRVMMRVEA